MSKKKHLKQIIKNWIHAMWHTFYILISYYEINIECDILYINISYEINEASAET